VYVVVCALKAVGSPRKLHSNKKKVCDVELQFDISSRYRDLNRALIETLRDIHIYASRMKLQCVALVCALSEN